MNRIRTPVLVAIVGGSGSGKTWLARKLRAALGPQAVSISLDDFYQDRSHLPPAKRERINFDHPQAIDWLCVKHVLRECLSGRPAQSPGYDFKTHCRRPETRTFHPKTFVLMDGLWLLHRPALRRLFHLRVFIECPQRTRLQRRLNRDLRSRGRTEDSVKRQFRKNVEPMHARFVTPQKRWADLVLKHNFGKPEVRQLAQRLRTLALDEPS
jgi:uridine kinase